MGGFTSAIVFLAEQRGIRDVWQQNNWLTSSGFVGAVLAGVLGLLSVSVLSDDFVWRAALFLGGVLGLLVAWLRLWITEGDELKEARAKSTLALLESLNCYR